MNEKSKPHFERRVGSIRAAVWENVTEGKPTWYNVSLLRRYKDGDVWKESYTYAGLGDLAQLAEAMDLAREWIRRRMDEQTSESEAVE